MTDETFLAELRRARLMAIVRAADPAPAEAAARVLLEEGVRFVEVALTTPDGLGVIERLRPHVPEGSWLGAGTVLTRDDVARVESVGGQFIVTPAVVESLDEAVCRSLPSVVGALSPTEIVTARARGASVVKLFPASVGGPAYLKAVRDPLPDVPILAVGGVGLEEARAFLQVGALGVGVGGPLVGDAASGGSLDALRARARAFLELVTDLQG
ncbi:MAG TPA: bifunctional 4-hydroxy-2-oxoglutarate aldolase/2-dehydro-3-deoxy-phosphogluconate aldolase [Intrasporangium sp.]|nr:bifunctional 4-hydroxy-2-oxoglutarate aldolase/2-dehydro-3-deoxy-phosphogluconate aldolase [Intrasporangium sp.]